MATYTIKAVHLVPGPGLRPHKHIGSVKLTTGTMVTRANVIASIRAGHRFVTNATPPGNVYVHRCPTCGASDYITTHADSTPKNNLLDMPKF